MPQRYAGLNFSLIGVNQMGDGKIYLQYGRLYVSVLATNNVNMMPSSFTYHVMEHFEGGNQYDITAPLADDTSIQDIRSLIIPGTIRPITDEDETMYNNAFNIPVTSTQYYYSPNIRDYMPGSTSTNLTQYDVSIAFTTGTNLPTDDDWQSAEWAPSITSNIVQFLVGPSGYTLVAGYYRVWVQVNATPQQAVLPVGFLNIYQAA
jgi:hypothetical protein